MLEQINCGKGFFHIICCVLSSIKHYHAAYELINTLHLCTYVRAWGSLFFLENLCSLNVLSHFDLPLHTFSQGSKQLRKYAIRSFIWDYAFIK